MTPKFSIVVPTYKRPESLLVCLTAIEAARARLDVPSEVVVADDGDASLTRDLIRRLNSDAVVIQGPKRGPAANRNFGTTAASGEWLVFTDDDCIPDADWLQQLHIYTLHCIEVRVLEGCTRADRDRQTLGEESPVNESGGYLWSCNMAIRRDFFEGLGGFCETFPFAAMEDVDLRERIRSAGEKFVFIASAVVCHPYRPAKDWRFQIRRATSYRHLLCRQPHLLKNRGSAAVVTNLLRKLKQLLVLVLRYGPRGSVSVLMLAILEAWIELTFLVRPGPTPGDRSRSGE